MDYPYTQQAPASDTPEGVLQRVVAALHARRWSEVAGYVDPESVEQFAAGQVAELHELETRRSTVDAMRGRSTLSPESLQRLARNEEDSKTARLAFFAAMYGGRNTSEQLRQLTPQEVFLLWLAASDPREQVRRSVAHLEPTRPELASAVLQAVPSFRREFGRAEYDGADRARVEYREWITVPGTPEVTDPVVRVAELRRVGGAWRILVDSELMGHQSFLFVVENDEP